MSAFASPRSDAWKLRQSNPEEALRQLQAVVQNDPNDAKAYWFLTLIQKDLNRPADALQSLENARRADPSQSFSSADSIAKIERSLQRSIGRSGNSSSPSFPSSSSPRSGSPGPGELANNAIPSGIDAKEVFQSLDSSGVFVAPVLRDRVNTAQIEAAVKGASNSTKVVVLDRLPRGLNDPGPLTQDLHKRLALGSGLMIVVSDRPRSLGIYGAGLDKPSLNEIALRTAKTFDSEGYAAGISRVIALVDEEQASRARAGRNLILFIIGVPTALVIWAMQRGKKRRAAETAQAREMVITESNRLTPIYEKLSNDYEYALLDQKDPQHRDALLAAQQRAGEAFSEAMKRLKYARSTADYDTVRGYLKNADREIQRARNVLNGQDADAGLPPQYQAQGNDAALQSGTGEVWYSDGVEVPPMGANLPGAQPGYALDFFTSQPVPRDQMVPVDLTINGQQRRVWASPQSAQNALNGNPQIATINDNGQQRAWFDTQSYNPWQSFGSQALQMIALNMLINSMMNNRGYGGGYQSGYDPGYQGGGWGGGYDRGPSSQDYGRDRDYDNRVNDQANEAGSASLESPFGDWSGSSSSDAGSASMDAFGGGGWSGGSDRS